MINYMREHPEVGIISTDSAYRREISWTADSDDFPKSWRISLTDLQRGISSGDEKVRQTAGFLTSSKGRQDVVGLLFRIAKEGAKEGANKDFADFVGNPPVLPPPPPPRTRFQIIDDD
jgi:hypothetical protein